MIRLATVRYEAWATLLVSVDEDGQPDRGCMESDLLRKTGADQVELISYTLENDATETSDNAQG